jgi:hypothetical protein
MHGPATAALVIGEPLAVTLAASRGAVAPGVFCIYVTPRASSRLTFEAVSLTVQRSITRPAFGTATSVYAHDDCTGTGALLDPPNPGRSYDVAVDTFSVNAGTIVPTDVGFVLAVPRAGG